MTIWDNCVSDPKTSLRVGLSIALCQLMIFLIIYTHIFLGSSSWSLFVHIFPLVVPVTSVYGLFSELTQFMYRSPSCSSLLSDFLHSLHLIPTFISSSPIACEHRSCVLSTPPDDKGAECEGDGPSVLSSTRQANRRRSKIRIMRGALAWANWNDTHSHRWSCTHSRTQTLLWSFKSMPIYLFVCLSAFFHAHSSAFFGMIIFNLGLASLFLFFNSHW